MRRTFRRAAFIASAACFVTIAVSPGAPALGASGNSVRTPSICPSLDSCAADRWWTEDLGAADRWWTQEP